VSTGNVGKQRELAAHQKQLLLHQHRGEEQQHVVDVQHLEEEMERNLMYMHQRPKNNIVL
jgi:hypothetical protein